MGKILLFHFLKKLLFSFLSIIRGFFCFFFLESYMECIISGMRYRGCYFWKNVDVSVFHLNFSAEAPSPKDH